MVVPPPLRWSSRAAALALTLLLVTPVLVLQGAAQTEDLPTPGESEAASAANWLLKQRQSDVRIVTSTGRQVWFLDNHSTTTPTQSTAIVETTIYNHGGQDSPSVPVYFWFSDLAADPNQDTLPVKCEAVVVPRATLGPGGTSVPGSVVAKWPFAVPAGVPPGGYNITISVNQAPSQYQPGPGIRKNPEVSRFGTSTNPCPTEKHAGVGGLQVDPPSPDHVAHAYFVKDKRLDLRIASSEDGPGIRWCKGEPTSAGACDPVGYMPDGPYPFVYNRTVHSQKPNEGTGAAYVNNPYVGPTYFQVNVMNAGTLEDTTDYGSACRCKGFPYAVRATVIGHGYAPETTIAWANADANGVGWHTVANMTLREKAGHYHVNVTLDPTNATLPQGRLPEAGAGSETNNKAGRSFEVQWVDFAAGINATDFRTSAANAYDYTPDFRIVGNVTFRNLGPAPLLHPENLSTGEPRAKVPYRIHIPGTNLSASGTFDADQDPNVPGIQFHFANVLVDFSATSIVGHDLYVRPGTHTLVAVIDDGDLSHEPNESNNRATLDIYVADKNPPVITTPLYVTEYGVAGQEHAITKTRPAKALALHAAVDDEDRANLTVVARFTLEGNASRQRNYTLEQSTSVGPDFYAAVFNFTFDGNGSVQNWTYALDVTDAFGNKVSSSTTKRLTLERYPIHSIPESQIVRQYPDGQSFNYSDDDPIAYQIYLTEEWTGVTNQTNVTANLFMVVEPAGGDRFNNSNAWAKLTECLEQGVGLEGRPLTEKRYICNAANPEFYSHFQNVVSRPPGQPGLWNISMRINDAAGETRYVNRTLFLTDAPPVAVAQEVLQRDAASVWQPARSADNGQRIWVNATFSDDRPGAMTAFANFTRSDGRSANFSLARVASFDVRDEATGDLVPHSVFNSSVAVGQARDLGIGGDLNLTVVARDATGNWVSAPTILFKVNDTQVPTLLEARATPAIQEVGQNVTFSVRVADETNVTALVSIQNGDVDILPPTPMTGADGRNFTYTTTVATEGNYAWTIAVRDSLNQANQETGTLAIRDNLGPRYEIRGPSNVIAGARFGPALPRIDLVAFDSDGVDPTSIVLVVDGQPVVPEVGPAPEGVNGLALSYQVPASRRFFHGEEVTVNVSAKDGSAKRLDGNLSFAFRVDDVAPTARLASFTPQFRDGPSQDWNVSLETIFRIEADDSDNLPTDVAAIRYRILVAGGNSGENLYTGPFRIRDVAGVYRGPTTYQIQYWAEDSAGNVNSTRLSTRVYVDDAPPELVQYFPQGYHVNATFVDDRVGVGRAVVWHRVNAEPYRPLTLEHAGNNLWQGVIPEARKGDRVSYYLQAWDQLDNTQTFGNASEPRVSFAATNHNPAIRVTTPVTGSRVSGTFNLEWTAGDEDGDALTFLVSVKSPGKTGYTELAKLDAPDTRRYPVDSRRFLDGEHVFRVSANDGGVVRHSEITVRVLNRADPIVSVSPVTGDVVPGSTVLLKAEVAKAEAAVEARLYLDGTFVGAYEMNDEGRDGDEVANDGVYSVRAPVESSGDYSVEILTRYQEDGVTKSSNRMDAITFSSRMTPGYVLREYAVVLVLIALAAAVAIGLGAWAVMRKRR